MRWVGIIWEVIKERDMAVSWFLQLGEKWSTTLPDGNPGIKDAA